MTKTYAQELTRRAGALGYCIRPLTPFGPKHPDDGRALVFYPCRQSDTRGCIMFKDETHAKEWIDSRGWQG